MSLSGITVACRLAVRRTTRAGLWYDDYVMIAALLFSYGTGLAVLFGLHFSRKTVGTDRIKATEKWFEAIYAIEQVYTPTIALVKSSILLFYARVFPGVRFRRYLYGLGAVVALWWIACQFTTIFECTPIHFFWTQNPTTGHCINVKSYFIGQAIPNIITDIFIMALPLPLIWKLNLPQKQKFALSGIFLLGGFVTFSSIYRLVHLINLLKVSYDYPGFPYVTSVMWTVIEINMAIVSACLPMLRRLFEHAFKLRKSAKKVSDPVAKADDRPLNRAHSFERLHKNSEDLWKTRDSTTIAIPSTITTVERAAVKDQHESTIALDVIRMTDEVRWSNVDP